MLSFLGWSFLESVESFLEIKAEYREFWWKILMNIKKPQFLQVATILKLPRQSNNNACTSAALCLYSAAKHLFEPLNLELHWWSFEWFTVSCVFSGKKKHHLSTMGWHQITTTSHIKTSSKLNQSDSSLENVNSLILVIPNLHDFLWI